MQLRIGHGTRLEPTIKYLFDPPVHALLTVYFKLKGVNEFAMQILNPFAAKLFQLVDRTNANSIT